MKKWLRNRKAVSPVIAALLLIAISVAAAVITYSWVMTMIDDQGRNAQTSMRVDDVAYFKDTIPAAGDDPAYDVFGISVTIRNTGSVPTTIQTVYVYDSSIRMLKADAIDLKIAAGKLKSVGITTAASWNTIWGTVEKEKVGLTAAFTWELETGYTVKVVTDNGFIIEGIKWSPSVWPTA